MLVAVDTRADKWRNSGGRGGAKDLEVSSTAVGGQVVAVRRRYGSIFARDGSPTLRYHEYCLLRPAPKQPSGSNPGPAASGGGGGGSLKQEPEAEATRPTEEDRSAFLFHILPPAEGVPVALLPHAHLPSPVEPPPVAQQKPASGGVAGGENPALALLFPPVLAIQSRNSPVAAPAVPREPAFPPSNLSRHRGETRAAAGASPGGASATTNKRPRKARSSSSSSSTAGAPSMRPTEVVGGLRVRSGVADPKAPLLDLRTAARPAGQHSTTFVRFEEGGQQVHGPSFLLQHSLSLS